MSADRMPCGAAVTRFFRADQDIEGTARYLSLKDKTFRRASWALHDFDQADLVARNALIVLTSVKDDLSGEDRPAAALHLVVDGAGVARIQGVVTDDTLEGKGYGTANLAEALRYARDELRLEAAELVVRILEGKPNALALALFTKAGFQPVAEIAVVISGLPCDAHLKATADADGMYRSLRMSLDLRTWQQLSRAMEASS